MLVEKIGHINPTDLNECGDVELNIVYVSHEQFKLDPAYNLIYIHTISVFESIVGGRISFEHLSGINIILNIAGAIVPNTQRMIPDYGIPQGDRITNLVVRFNISYPDGDVSDVEKALIRDTFSRYFSSNSPFMTYDDDDCVVFDS
jgi:DnaJ-class molecular chaperone